MSDSSRGTWASRSTFILAAIGSAVGLGNAWRFPGLCAKHGGGAFMLVYLAAMLVIGIILLVRGRKQQVWLHGPCAPSLKAVLQNAGMFLLIVTCFVQTVFNYL